MKRLENKIGILQHKVKNTNQLKIKNQNLRLEKMRLLKAVERRDKKIKELSERINKANEWIDKHIEKYDAYCVTIIDWDQLSDPREIKKILKGE